MFILQQMLITKREEVTKQGFTQVGGVGWAGLFEFDWEEEGVGAYSRLGAYELFWSLGWALIWGGC